MAPGFNRNQGNKAVTLLATCLVVLGGAITFFVVAISNESRAQQQSALSLAGATTAGIIVLLWLLRDRSDVAPKRSLWGWLARKRKRKVAYKAKLLRPATPDAPGSKPPPTVDSIRSINAGKNVWTPSATPSRNNKDQK